MAALLHGRTAARLHGYIIAGLYVCTVARLGEDGCNGRVRLHLYNVQLSGDLTNGLPDLIRHIGTEGQSDYMRSANCLRELREAHACGIPVCFVVDGDSNLGLEVSHAITSHLIIT